MNLEEFTTQIENFDQLSAGEKIKYFAYYLHVEEQIDFLKVTNITWCFDQLHLNSYSNIHQYLLKGASNTSYQQFLKTKSGFKLFGPIRKKIETELRKDVILRESNSLYPLAIFENTKSYLQAFANEASTCYEVGLYNSSLFMLRKICEILIIELYETRELTDKIKNPKGDYFQLSELIGAVINEPSWKLSKVPKENLPKIKQLADSSVHSKRFRARKVDIDQMKTDIRVIFEEFITLIDYQSNRK